MGLRESWNELDTGMKVLVGLVAGAILFVVAIPIVLILAAVVGSFVLSAGAPADAVTPTASFEYDYDDSAQTVKITHEGGEAIEASKLEVRVDRQTTAWDGTGQVVAGDSMTVELSSGSTVSVIWRGEDESATLSRWEAPASLDAAAALAG